MLFGVHLDPMELTNLADKPKYLQTHAPLAKLFADYNATA
jgi:hypothetical protein